MIKGEIYCITCLATEKKYIGQTIRGYRQRYRAHWVKASNGKTKLYEDMRRFGKHLFEISLLETVQSETKESLKSELDIREKFWIETLGTRDNGYNSTDGGSGYPGGHFSEETRKKMSELNKGKRLSKEIRQKISKSVSGDKHPLYGSHRSDETRRKISEANKGKPSSKRGKKLSELHKKEISLALSKYWANKRKLNKDDYGKK
jgi:group I intron endonuclease